VPNRASTSSPLDEIIGLAPMTPCVLADECNGRPCRANSVITRVGQRSPKSVRIRHPLRPRMLSGDNKPEKTQCSCVLSCSKAASAAGTHPLSHRWAIDCIGPNVCRIPSEVNRES
jgi:hypothetical protein